VIRGFTEESHLSDWFNCLIKGIPERILWALFQPILSMNERMELDDGNS